MKHYIKYFFSNRDAVLSPYYNSGFMYSKATKYMPWESVTMAPYACKMGWALPVVPVPHIIDLINEVFDIDFKLCQTISVPRTEGYLYRDTDYQQFIDATEDEFESSLNIDIINTLDDEKYSKIFDVGVVPCIKAQPSKEMCEQAKISISGICNNNNKYSFDIGSIRNDYLTTIIVRNGNGRYISPLYNWECLKVKGYVSVLFKYDDVYTKLVIDPGAVYIQIEQIKMKFMQDKGSGVGTELDSVSAVIYPPVTFDGTTYAHLMFDMRSRFGVEYAKLEDLAYGNEHPQFGQYQGDENRGIYIEFEGAKPVSIQEAELSFEPYFNEGGRPRPMNAMYSLPKITCIDFMKSLYYMDGGFPKFNEDGSIGISHFSDLLTNIKKGNVYNWSKSIINETPNISNSDKYKQHNLFMSASDDEDNDKPINEDGYANYKLDVRCDNDTLEEKETIIKVPFYAPYVENPTHKSIKTGNTFKYWDVEEIYAFDESTEEFSAKYSASESNPSFGYLSGAWEFNKRNWYGIDARGEYWQAESQPDAVVLKFNPWSGFNGDSYDLLKHMIRDNKVLKANVNVSLIELSTIDYAKPVYIEQYNSYFAIINVDWHSQSGISEVELIKIPY